MNTPDVTGTHSRRLAQGIRGRFRRDRRRGESATGRLIHPLRRMVSGLDGSIGRPAPPWPQPTSQIIVHVMGHAHRIEPTGNNKVEGGLSKPIYGD
ncbi:Uncharacterized protein DBV15_07580 [Temnothorax longispinosus]|uniref:Uncharacterized protein n=1 Tax=Temnothorax longispinosus TaxID=300112 RepID=A0A4S2LC02_9HYME|nr:Uncharacterized protein DBV15_07580 [Temnothorax longispinosus]